MRARFFFERKSVIDVRKQLPLGGHGPASYLIAYGENSGICQVAIFLTGLGS
jgi:hypothetical protein